MPAWAKTLIYTANTLTLGLTHLAFDFAGLMYPVSSDPTEPSPDQWRKYRFRYHDVNSPLRADDQVFTLNIVNYTNGAVDNSWTAGDYSTVWGHLYSFLGGLATDISPVWSLDLVEAYAMAFNEYTYTPDGGKTFPPFAPSGPPAWAFAAAIPSTGTAAGGPQCTSTVTLRTPSRPHWGRFYIPTLSGSAYGVAHRVAPGPITAILGLGKTLVEGLAADGFYLVVPTTQVNGHPTRTLQVVTQLEMDDVPDVIRRRRWREPGSVVVVP